MMRTTSGKPLLPTLFRYLVLDGLLQRRDAVIERRMAHEEAREAGGAAALDAECRHLGGQRLVIPGSLQALQCGDHVAGAGRAYSGCSYL